MPQRDFTDPSADSLKVIKLDDAAQYFEDAGILPLEVTTMLVKEASYTRPSDPRYLSPSKIYPPNLCRRQIVLDSFLTYDLNPYKAWQRKEGSLWHSAFATAKAGPDWLHEVRLPDDLILADDDGRLKALAPPDCEFEDWMFTDRADELFDQGVLKTCDDGRIRLEVCPGLWMRGFVDRLSADYKKIVDHKTKAPPFSRPPDYIPKNTYDTETRDEAAYQLSAYAHMVEMCTGVANEGMWIWRFFRGCKRPEQAWRKMQVRLISRDRIWEDIKDYISPLLGWLSACYDIQQSHLANDSDPIEAIKKYIADNIPQDGHLQQMFNGQKCTKFCEHYEVCFGLETGFIDF